MTAQAKTAGGPKKLILPPKEARKAAKAKAAADEKKVASMMPQPAGYQILVLIPPGEAKTEGGIYKPDSLLQREATACVYGMVHEMGPLAYKDPVRFPDGKPWCKKGDWVLFTPFAGIRLDVSAQEMRLINDDGILAVVEDPRGITRK